jgi:Spy/CpxP family protein refolding chaperone
MKRHWLILSGGLLLAVAAFACVYLVATAPMRSVSGSERPALVWMQREYRLTDAQFARLCALHEAYRARCMEMCRRIDEKNTQLEALLSATNSVTPAVKQALAEAAQIRAECQAGMLEHFYAVAQTMPPEQGRRYLEWVQRETLKTQPMLPDRSEETPQHAP